MVSVVTFNVAVLSAILLNVVAPKFFATNKIVQCSSRVEYYDVIERIQTPYPLFDGFPLLRENGLHLGQCFKTLFVCNL
jgi:hypothetical protein